jgi:hypothetical protein
MLEIKAVFQGRENPYHQSRKEDKSLSPITGEDKQLTPIAENKPFSPIAEEN